MKAVKIVKMVKGKKIVLILLLCVAAYFLGGRVAMLADNHKQEVISRSVEENWGLGFSEPGQPP